MLCAKRKFGTASMSVFLTKCIFFLYGTYFQNSELTFREGAGAYPYKKLRTYDYRKSVFFVKSYEYIWMRTEFPLATFIKDLMTSRLRSKTA